MSEKDELSEMRQYYEGEMLHRSELDQDPIKQFEEWFQLACSSDIFEPNSMILSTSTGDKPSARVVLLKEVKEDGIVFFTNYNSRKGRELAANNFASLLFYWDRILKQVRFEGKVEKISAAESEAYFNSRPEGSRQSAVASPQSEIVPDRAFLEDRFTQVAKDGMIKRPEHWGGYILRPYRAEFWQGRANRLHDRFEYSRAQDGNWQINRLAP